MEVFFQSDPKLFKLTVKTNHTSFLKTIHRKKKKKEEMELRDCSTIRETVHSIFFPGCCTGLPKLSEFAQTMRQEEHILLFILNLTQASRIYRNEVTLGRWKIIWREIDRRIREFKLSIILFLWREVRI